MFSFHSTWLLKFDSFVVISFAPLNLIKRWKWKCVLKVQVNLLQTKTQQVRSPQENYIDFIMASSSDVLYTAMTTDTL